MANKFKQARDWFIDNVVLRQSAFKKAIHRLRAREGTYANVARDRNGLRFLYAPTDFTVGAALVDRGEWQYDELDNYVDFVSGKAKGRTAWFFDLGANIGTQTVYAARSGIFERVFAVEAIPSTYALLRDNILLNECSDITSCFNVALGSESGRQTFIFNPLNPGGSRRHDGHADCENIELNVVRTSEFVLELLQSESVPEVLAFWVDVEGMEWDVVSELRFLGDDHEVYFCIEYNEESYSEESNAALRDYVESRDELYSLTQAGLAKISALSAVSHNQDIIFSASPAAGDAVEKSVSRGDRSQR